MAERVRLVADEHISRAVSDGLRRRGIDIVTCHEIGMRGAPDRDHLVHAQTAGRAILTRDADFLRLHAEGREHAGIIYCPKDVNVGRMIRGVMLLCELLSPCDMRGHVEFLPGV